jgi:hypothetical protein
VISLSHILPNLCEEDSRQWPNRRTYWACPDEALMAFLGRLESEPVASLSAIEGGGEAAFAAVAEQIKADGVPVKCTLGGVFRDHVDWMDNRKWYAVHVQFTLPIPAQRKCPFRRSPLTVHFRDGDGADLFQQAINTLASGDFKLGWSLYENRWFTDQGQAQWLPWEMPHWDGIVRPGMKLLVHGAQGFGDQIMFARYLPALDAMGIQSDLLCSPELTPLLKRLDYKGNVSHWLGPEIYDYHLPICSLPLAVDRLSDWPPSLPYLSADPIKQRVWGASMENYSSPCIGICWAGRPVHPNNRARSVTLEQFEPILRGGGRIFSLQKGDYAEQLKYLPDDVRVHDFTADLHDFSDTAALIANLDLVVTVDTAVAHLAGAMGKRTWLIAGDHPEWRWKPDLERARSRWYPSVRIMRTLPNNGAWESQPPSGAIAAHAIPVT